jgi:hypothetical protein
MSASCCEIDPGYSGTKGPVKPVCQSGLPIPVCQSRSANPYGVTVSDVALVAIPSAVVIVILPDSAPTGTVKPICV